MATIYSFMCSPKCAVAACSLYSNVSTTTCACFRQAMRAVHFLCAGPAINHFQQVEAKGAIFWEPLVFAIGLAEAYRVGLGWEYPKSENFYQLRDDYEVRGRCRRAGATDHARLRELCTWQT